jgi:hypothetical protein
MRPHRLQTERRKLVAIEYAVLFAVIGAAVFVAANDLGITDTVTKLLDAGATFAIFN